MAYGFEVYNNSGTIQLADNLQNPVMISKGNMTVSTGGYGGNNQCTLSYTRASLDNFPMVAIRPTAATGLIWVSNSTTLTPTWNFITSQASGTTVPYWIFDIKAPTPTAYGLQIWDASGTLIFSSAEKPIRISSILTGSMGTISGGTDFTGASGRTYAIVLSRWTEVFREQLHNPGYSDHYLFAVSGKTDGIATGSILLTSGVGGGDTNFIERHALIVDVTNY